MSTTTADNRPAPYLAPPLAFEDGQLQDEAVLIGPAMRGWVYRSCKHTRWYRLIPLHGVPIAWRHELRTGRPTFPSPTMLGPDRDWQTTDGSGCIVISYPDEEASRSLADCIHAPSAFTRSRGAIALLRTLPGWWRELYRPILPLPAELIVGKDGQLRFLWIPKDGTPRVETVFSAPERGLYLSPELVRSSGLPRNDASWEALDRYAVGVSLLACYFRLPAIDGPARVLFRTATGSLLAGLPARTDLPPWLGRFSVHRRVLGQIQRLTSAVQETRNAVDLAALAGALEETERLLDPRVAAARLRESADPLGALRLLQEAFPLLTSLGLDETAHADLLLLAGELCAQYLQQPLEAVDYYERASGLPARREAALQQQLRLLANARRHPALSSLIRENNLVAAEVDIKVWRNYHALAANRSTRALDEDGTANDLALAEYLLWRGHYADARDFIFPRLCDEQKRYFWWDFPLNLAYVEAFVGLEDGDGTQAALAAEQLQGIKGGLLQVRQNRSMDANVIHRYGERVADLEVRIFHLRQAAQAPHS